MEAGDEEAAVPRVNPTTSISPPLPIDTHEQERGAPVHSSSPRRQVIDPEISLTAGEDFSQGLQPDDPVAAEEQTSRWSGEGSTPRRLSLEARLAVAQVPESVVEAIALRAAASSLRSSPQGPLAAARTLACIFQVCTTWRLISRSELLWESAYNLVWAELQQPISSWREEYIRAHSTAANISRGRARHTVLSYEGGASNNNNNNACRCLAISRNHLAGGFFDGAVRVFDLDTKACVRTMRPRREDRFGAFSRAIAGVSLQDEQVVFASLDGSVFTGSVRSSQSPTLVHVGNIIEDGALISFAGSSRWWIGLYAGSPGRSFRVWDSVSREIVYTGGDAMDSDAMRGWQSFVEQAGQIGRVRFSRNGFLVTATRSRISVHEVGIDGLPVVAERAEQNAVEAVDVHGNNLLSASYNGLARVRSVPDMEGVSEVRHGGDNQMQMFGTLNSRQLFLCISGSVNAWDVRSGEHLYSLQERLNDDVYDLVANDSFLAACVADSGLHVWDFSN